MPIQIIDRSTGAVLVPLNVTALPAWLNRVAHGLSLSNAAGELQGRSERKQGGVAEECKAEACRKEQSNEVHARPLLPVGLANEVGASPP